MQILYFLILISFICLHYQAVAAADDPELAPTQRIVIRPKQLTDPPDVFFFPPRATANQEATRSYREAMLGFDL